MRIRAFVAAVAILPSTANAAKPLHLALTSPWVIDYAKNSCRLIGHFGQGADTTMLAFESEAPGALDMIIVGKPVASDAYEVPARFLPVQTKPKTTGIPGRSTDKFVPMVLFSTVYLLPDEALARQIQENVRRFEHPFTRPPAVSLAEWAVKEAQRKAFAVDAVAIEIDSRRDRTVILDTGSLGGAMEAFDKCSRDSLRDWGVDPELEDKIVRPVWTSDPQLGLRSEDYPQDMANLGRISDVKVRVLVDATGHITKCTSLSHFNEPVFNQIVCDKLTAKAHFEPAEVADGTKVPSYYVSNIKFRLAD